MTPEQRSALAAIVAADDARQVALALRQDSGGGRRDLVEAHREASRTLNARIVAGNAAGLSYQTIADALGVSKQMVGQRVDGHRKSERGEPGWLPPWSRRRKNEPVA